MTNQPYDNKLVLLYLIREKVNITHQELMSFVLFREYGGDFFSVQNALDELTENELILKITRGDDIYYTLLSKGEEVLEMFRSRISHSVREEIRMYAENSYMHESPLLEAVSDCEKRSGETGDIYRLNLMVKDYEKEILVFRTEVDNETDADSIRRQWAAKGMNIYWNMLKELEIGNGSERKQ